MAGGERTRFEILRFNKNGNGKFHRTIYLIHCMLDSIFLKRRSTN